MDTPKSPAEQWREEQERRRIQDEMERYYNPERFRKTQKQRDRNRRALSSVFVGGLPYDSF